MYTLSLDSTCIYIYRVRIILKLKYSQLHLSFLLSPFLSLLKTDTRVSVFFLPYIHTYRHSHIENQNKSRTRFLPNICLHFPSVIGWGGEKRFVFRHECFQLCTHFYIYIHHRGVSSCVSQPAFRQTKFPSRKRQTHSAQWRCYYYMALELLRFNHEPRDCARG